MKRLSDILFCLFALPLFGLLMLFIALAILLSDRGKVIYRQTRVGRFGKDFQMLKFRTMHEDADRKGLLTVGDRDPRVTRIGYWLRRTKLDELPQLINVLKGDMSVVGPRPEVRKYVNMYTSAQREVLDHRPGITDRASVAYMDESELLAYQSDPERYYIDVVMPDKLRLNLAHIHDPDPLKDLKVIIWTVSRMI